MTTARLVVLHPRCNASHVPSWGGEYVPRFATGANYYGSHDITRIGLVNIAPSSLATTSSSTISSFFVLLLAIRIDLALRSFSITKYKSVKRVRRGGARGTCREKKYREEKSQAFLIYAWWSTQLTRYLRAVLFAGISSTPKRWGCMNPSRELPRRDAPSRLNGSNLPSPQYEKCNSTSLLQIEFAGHPGALLSSLYSSCPVLIFYICESFRESRAESVGIRIFRKMMLHTICSIKRDLPVGMNLPGNPERINDNYHGWW